MLPDKLSELIIVALKDIEAVRNTPGMEINMSDWHTPVIKGNGMICQVCFAGAVMSQSLHANPASQLDPDDFDGDISHKLEALDSLRSGEIDTAVNEFTDYASDFESINKEFYQTRAQIYFTSFDSTITDPNTVNMATDAGYILFVDRMNAIADILKTRGL